MQVFQQRTVCNLSEFKLSSAGYTVAFLMNGLSPFLFKKYEGLSHFNKQDGDLNIKTFYAKMGGKNEQIKGGRHGLGICQFAI